MRRATAVGCTVSLLAGTALVAGGVVPAAAAGATTQTVFIYRDQGDPHQPVGVEQSWKAPAAGVVKLETVGGGGGGSNTAIGGNGAIVTSWHQVAAGATWTIRVGGGGYPVAGGSATAVLNGSTPLAVAGAGGGATLGYNGGSGAANGTARGGDGLGANAQAIGKGGAGVTTGTDDGAGGNGGGLGGGIGGSSAGSGNGAAGDPAQEGGGGGGWAGTGAHGGNGGAGSAGASEMPGGLSQAFARQHFIAGGGGGAGFGAGGGAYGGGGGYGGGGAGACADLSCTQLGSGGAGGSFARTADKPGGSAAPVYQPGPLTIGGVKYGVGGLSGNGGASIGGVGGDGVVRVTFTPAAPGKPANLQTQGGLYAGKYVVKWAKSKNATSATKYVVRVKLRGSSKVLVRTTTKKRHVNLTRARLIKAADRASAGGQLLRFRVIVHAVTGAKKSKPNAKPLSVRR